MNTRITLLCLSLLTSGTALANGGTITFQGEIVEAGCSVTAVKPSQDGRNTANPSLQIADANDACSQSRTALTTQYEQVKSTETHAEGTIITLTYN